MILLLLACAGSEDTSGKIEDSDSVVTDADGDGYGEDDCNDAIPAVHPGASERCDGADNDCDGEIDEDAVDMGTSYTDGDGDGYGDSATAVSACETTGVTVGGDCDDADAATHPGATEDCADPVDRDCDGTAGGEDEDGDGYLGCDDCDDGDAAVHPGATEVCDDDNVDEDCSGASDDADPGLDTATELDWYRDFDNDEHGDPESTSRSACDAPTGYVLSDDDCDDHDDDVYPGATEICDDADQDEDCSGAAEDADPGLDADSLLAWHDDLDGDGYGGSAVVAWACEAPEGLSADDTDCDDSNTALNPGADEVCDGVDNDCDGLSDDDDTVDGEKTTWYDDDDGDGYGDATTTISRCQAPSGWTDNPDDCDDRHATAFPGGTEVCDDDDVDEDCNGLADDEDPGHTGDLSLYTDADGDGYGGDVYVGMACNGAAGQAGNSDDCDDGNAASNPGATEVCDDAGTDEDCDGYADDLDPEGASGTVALYQDNDNDGYGNRTSAGSGCSSGDGAADNDGDCNDRDATISPGSPEICDGSDNDCDGATDDSDADVVGTSWYTDADGDGYGDDSTEFLSCTGPKDTIETGGDCDDTDPARSPGATELCDGADNDCDDLIDADDPSSSAAVYYRDADRDGYGDPEDSMVDCSPPSGYTLDGTDCDDIRASVNPLATEVCDSRDNNCDGAVDEGFSLLFPDVDADGFGDASATPTCDGDVDDGTDCDDADGTVNPGAEEISGDELDQDCDGALDALAKTHVDTDMTFDDGPFVGEDLVFDAVTLTIGPDADFQCNRCSFIDSILVVTTAAPSGADTHTGLYLYNSYLSGSSITATGVDGADGFTNVVDVQAQHTTWIDTPGDAVQATSEGSAIVTVFLARSAFYNTGGGIIASTGAVVAYDVENQTFGTDEGIFDFEYTPPRPAAGSPLLDTGTSRSLPGDYWGNTSTPTDIGAVER